MHNKNQTKKARNWAWKRISKPAAAPAPAWQIKSLVLREVPLPPPLILLFTTATIPQWNKGNFASQISDFRAQKPLQIHTCIYIYSLSPSSSFHFALTEGSAIKTRKEMKLLPKELVWRVKVSAFLWLQLSRRRTGIHGRVWQFFKAYNKFLFLSLFLSFSFFFPFS